TMRTPGNDIELAAGFLFGEGILKHAADLEKIDIAGPNVVVVTLRSDTETDITRLERNFYMTSSCGVCGKASIESIRSTGCPILPRNGLTLSVDTIHALPNRLRQSQAVFDSTGGLHAAAIFDADGNALTVREDVGRHNAVDKVIG